MVTWHGLSSMIWVLIGWRSHDPADLVNLKITWPNSSYVIGWKSHTSGAHSLDSDEVMKDIGEPTRNHGNIQKAMRGLVRVGREDGGREGGGGGGERRDKKTSVNTDNWHISHLVYPLTYLSIWILQFSLSSWSSGKGRDGGRGTASSQDTQLCVWSEGGEQMTPTGRGTTSSRCHDSPGTSILEWQAGSCVHQLLHHKKTWSPISRCPSHTLVPCRGKYPSTMCIAHVPDLWPHLCTDTAAVCVAQSAHSPHPHQP